MLGLMLALGSGYVLDDGAAVTLQASPYGLAHRLWLRIGCPAAVITPLWMTMLAHLLPSAPASDRRTLSLGLTVELAAAVIHRLGNRFARVSAAVGKVFDTNLIIIAGAVATACQPILDVIREQMPGLVEPPLPRVVASQLGEAVVSVGAVQRAIADVQEHALDIVLPGRVGPTPVRRPTVPADRDSRP